MTARIVGFVALARHAPREIGFGFLCNLASSPGQTFLIALFLPGIKSSFGLGDAEVSNLYALATVLALPRCGKSAAGSTATIF
jgi:hypothetical protein